LFGLFEKFYAISVTQTSHFFISYNQKNSNKTGARTCEVLATLVPFNTGKLINLLSIVGEFSPTVIN
jgi:hypothetical protein